MDPRDALAPGGRLVRASIALQELLLVAIVLAFGLTASTGTTEMRTVSVGVVVPIAAMSLAFIRYCRLGKAWGFLGATALGALGVVLRLVVSTRPDLEVGGGLPIGVTVLYFVLGGLVALTSLGSFLELRREGALEAL
jgi:hypothetical protein